MKNFNIEVERIIRHSLHEIEKFTPDTELLQAISKLISRWKGQILTTGIGKAGLIAKKMAATLASIGINASYLHPVEAVHGDSGRITHQTMLLVYSTSGKSDEIIQLLKQVKQLPKQRMPYVGAITSHPDAPVRKLVDFVIDMGIVKEACPLGLLPTTSLMIMLLISDIICIEVMERIGLTRQEFGLFHHAGYLGQKARENENEQKN